MTQPELTRQQADTELDRLDAERAAIAAALVELESHPGYRLLDSGVLTGETLRRWTSTKTAIVGIYQQFETYRRTLDRARELRSRKAFGELATLLHGEAVELTTEALPLAQRTLTGPSAAVQRVSLRALVERMNTAFTQVTEVVTAADTIWTAVLRRLDPVEQRLRAAEALDLVEYHDELRMLRDDITGLRQRLVTDPLSVPANAGAELPARTDAVVDRLARIAAVRDGFAERVRELKIGLDRLAAAEADAGATRDAVLVKIASSALPPIVERASALRAGLDRLVSLHSSLRAPRRDGDHWQQLADRLPALEREVDDALRLVQAEREAIASLLARRDELRGRLDAYRAKAAGLGHSEDHELGRRYDTAHELLWTAPCDLPAATRALASYQQAITAKEAL